MPDNNNSKNNLTPVLENEIVSIKTKSPIINVTQRFKNLLQVLPTTIKQTESLLSKPIDQLIANNDEEALDELTKSLRACQSDYRAIKKTRTDIRKIFNQQRDAFVGMFDAQLQDAQFDKLEDYDKQIKQIKRDITEHRRNSRWEELKSTFDADIEAFPIINELAPALADFSSYRLHNSSLVKGAKNFKVTDKLREHVNNDVAQWAKDLENIRQNPANLNDVDLNALYQDYIRSYGDSRIIGSRTSFYQQQEKAQRQAELLRKKQEEEARKRAEEEAKKAKANGQKAPQEPAKSAQPAPAKPVLKPNQPVKPTAEPYKWLVDLILTNSTWRTSLSNGTETKQHASKLEIIEAVLKAHHVNNSTVNKNTHNDIDELYGAIEYIMNLHF